MLFTKEELNALGIMVSNTPIKGSDGKFVANLLDKIQAALQAPDDGAPDDAQPGDPEVK